MRSAILFIPLGLLWLFATGCSSTRPTVSDYRSLLDSYYGGDLERAAAASKEYSDREADYYDDRALLWHLEAASINFDAGRSEEARQSLERAEKLFYLYDSQGKIQAQTPGNTTYTGFRHDRAMVNLFKFLNYMEKNKMEDALVEIRRMRQHQFRYLLKEQPSDVVQYDESVSGQIATPYRMKEILGDDNYKAIYNQSLLANYYGEYSQRRRPKLSLFFNPLPFYFSTLGYYFDSEYDEAAIDLQYLYMMQPRNELIKGDFATVYDILDERVPVELAMVKPYEYALNDNLCVLIFSWGKAPQPSADKRSFTLSGKVPAQWNFSYFTWNQDAPHSVSVESGGRKYTSSSLLNLNQMLDDEYWQLHFPGMVKAVRSAIDDMTTQNDLAKAQLAIALALPDGSWEESLAKMAAVAAAQAQVAATSSVTVNQYFNGSWGTLGQGYEIVHFPIPADRVVRVSLPSPSGTVEEKFILGADTTIAFIYIRELGTEYITRKFEVIH